MPHEVGSVSVYMYYVYYGNHAAVSSVAFELSDYSVSFEVVQAHGS